MQSIEYKKFCPKLNQIFDILAKMQNEDKQVTLLKISAHLKLKTNEAGKAAKQAIDMPGITRRNPETNYSLTIRRARNSEFQRKWETGTSKLHNIKPFIEEWESIHNKCRQYEIKLSRLHIEHTRLIHGHLM